MELFKYILILLRILKDLSEVLFVAGITRSNLNVIHISIRFLCDGERLAITSLTTATVGFASCFFSTYDECSTFNCDSRSQRLRSSLNKLHTVSSSLLHCCML